MKTAACNAYLVLFIKSVLTGNRLDFLPSSITPALSYM